MLYPAQLPAGMDHTHGCSRITLPCESSPEQPRGTGITEPDYATASALHVFVSKIAKNLSFV